MLETQFYIFQRVCWEVHYQWMITRIKSVNESFLRSDNNIKDVRKINNFYIKKSNNGLTMEVQSYL